VLLSKCFDAKDELTNASLLYIIITKGKGSPDRQRRPWIIALNRSGNTENFNLGNFIPSSRRNTISRSAELADSRPDHVQVKQQGAELEVTLQSCSPKIRNI